MSQVVSGTHEHVSGSHRRAALVLALFACVFLWTPVTSSVDATFVSSAANDAHPLLRVPPAADRPTEEKPASPVVDAASEEAWRTAVPWQLFSREKLTHGVLPTWNGSNGGGEPHLANPSTASLSPFSMPVYALGLKYGLLLAALARAFLLGWFTYLFLRELRTSFWAAVVGATCFMFSGHAVVGLLLPASGAAVTLPAGLWLVERLVHACRRDAAGEPTRDASASGVAAADRRARRERGQGHRRIDGDERAMRPALWLAVVLALGWLAGSVETFAVSIGTIGAWTIVRLATSIACEDDRARAVRVAARVVSALLVAVVLGAMASGIQALPWLEFLRDASDRTDPGTSAHATLAVFAWPLQVYPHLFGSPEGAFGLAADLPRPGYSEVTTTYVGGLALFLAACGVVTARSRFETWFFVAVVTFAWATTHGLLATRDLLAALPPWVVNPIGHVSVAHAFAIATLAALGVDRLTSREREASLGAAALVGASGVAFVWLSRLSAERLLVATLIERGDPTERVTAHLALDAHAEFVGAWLLVGVFAATWATATTSTTWRLRAGAILSLACFVTTGWLLRGTNATTPDERVYPRTEAVEEFGRATSGRNVLWLGESGLPPAVNVVYPLRSQGVPGPWRIRRHDVLQRALFDPRGPERVVTHTTEKALQTFGIEVVIDADRWLDVDTEFGDVPVLPALWYDSAEILPDSAVSQRFAAFRDRPQAVQLLFRTRGGRNAFTLVVAFEDAATHERFHERRFAPGEIRPRGEDYAAVTVRLPADAIPAGRPIVLRAEAPDALPGTGWSLRCRADVDDVLRDRCARGVSDPAASGGRRSLRADLWQASQGDRKLEGQVALDIHYAYDAFVQEARIGPYNVCGHKNWSSRFRTVGTSVVEPGASESLTHVLDASFDARRSVVLEAVAPDLARAGRAEDEQDTLVDVIEDVDGHARVVVKRRTPGFLVAPIAWYPGWTALVNKEPVPVMCANYAFTAVAVPAGESLVDFDYRPRSVTRGLVMSLLGVAGIVAGFAFLSKARRRPRETSGGTR